MYHIENERIISFVATELLPKRKKRREIRAAFKREELQTGSGAHPSGAARTRGYRFDFANADCEGGPFIGSGAIRVIMYYGE